MTIRCPNLGVFLDTIAGLVERGLTFTADADQCVIHLAGGY